MDYKRDRNSRSGSGSPGPGLGRGRGYGNGNAWGQGSRGRGQRYNNGGPSHESRWGAKRPDDFAVDGAEQKGGSFRERDYGGGAMKFSKPIVMDGWLDPSNPSYQPPQEDKFEFKKFQTFQKTEPI